MTIPFLLFKLSKESVIGKSFIQFFKNCGSVYRNHIIF